MRKEQCLLLLGLIAFASTGVMADNAAAPGQGSGPSQGILTTAPLLSDAEQAAYRARIRAAKDADEVERIRAAHYELLKARARDKGVVLPESRLPAFGVEGNAFGPQLITEEQRAAQRARMRAVRETSAPAAITPARQAPIGSEVRSATPGRLPDAAAPSAAIPVPPATPAVPASSSPVAAPVPPAAAPPSVPSTAAAVQPAPAAVPPAAAAVALPGIESIFATQLMTEEEKAAFRARLRSAKTDEDRQKIRAEREQQLRLRAKERGVALPQ